MQKYKCCICKLEIEIDPIQMQRIKKGEVVYSKKGVPFLDYYHSECYNIKLQKELSHKQWCDLYEYIKRTYFKCKLPKLMICQLQGYRKHFNSTVIQECLEFIEPNVIGYMNNIDFKTDDQRSNYIIAALSANINSFYERQLKNKEKQNDQQITETFQFLKPSNQKTIIEDVIILD